MTLDDKDAINTLIEKEKNNLVRIILMRVGQSGIENEIPKDYLRVVSNNVVLGFNGLHTWLDEQIKKRWAATVRKNTKGNVADLEAIRAEGHIVHSMKLLKKELSKVNFDKLRKLEKRGKGFDRS